MKNWALIGIFLAATPIARAAPSVQCWGNNAEGQSSVPADLQLVPLPANPVEVRTARGSTCVLGTQGTITCRGIPMSHIAKLEALTGVKTFSVSSEGACAVVNNQVQCFSGVGDATFEQVPTLKNPKLVSVSAASACALDDVGVQCWGGNDSQIASVPTLKNPKKVVAGGSDFCALDDTGVVCWGDGNSGIESIPALTKPTDVLMGSTFACAVDQNGLECWGTSTLLTGNVAKPDPNAHYVAGQLHVCSLTQNGGVPAVYCMGDNTYHQTNAPTLSNPTRIFADSVGNQTCAQDDSGIVCWGEDQASQSSLGAASSIAAGYGNTCVTIKGKMECWGTGSAAINTALPVTDAYQISLGADFACVTNVGAQSTTSCWGSNPTIPGLSPPLPPQDFTQGNQFLTPPAVIAGGFNHVCQYVPGQSFSCFGNNDFGQTKIPTTINPNQDMITLAVGGSHTCAIDSAQGLLCWGKNEFGESTVPKTLKNPRQVSAGFSHTCALDDNGVSCWGRGTEGQTTVPALSHPRYVQAGGYHTCALDDTGVVCWGDNSFGQSTVPKKQLNGRIASLATGLFHTCVVTQ